MKSGSRKNFFCFDDRDWPSWLVQQAHDGLSPSPVIPPPLAIITALLFIQLDPNAVASMEKSIFPFKNWKNRFEQKKLNSNFLIRFGGARCCMVYCLLWRVNNELSKGKANNRLPDMRWMLCECLRVCLSVCVDCGYACIFLYVRYVISIKVYCMFKKTMMMMTQVLT